MEIMIKRWGCTAPSAVCLTKLAVTLLLLTLISNCAKMPANRPVVVDLSAPKPGVLVAQLLYEAQVAYNRDRLSSPAHDNAFDRFKRVLNVDPDNAEAKRGIQKIAERYLKLANYAMQSGERKESLRYLNMAKKMDQHLGGGGRSKDAGKTPLPAASLLPKNTYYLSERDLKARGPAIKSLLEEIARKAVDIPSRLLIVVKHDADGRWIYQHMRQSAQGTRLRGNISYAEQPKIVLLDAPE